MRLNKKGFTLVELLAVIVILAVVMLIAVTAVGPLMTKSRKSALGTEGVGLVDAAKTAYQAEQLNNKSEIKATSTVCFDLQWLYSNNYFEKGPDDSYTGSVLVNYSGGTYTYRFWIGNGTYALGKTTGGLTGGMNPAGYDVENSEFVQDAAEASKDCGGYTKQATDVKFVKCTGTSACTVA